jgi:hypothetical protein
MKTDNRILLLVTFLLGACSASDMSPATSSSPGATDLPEGVVAMAAPNQDLASARVNPADGCYWYRHRGPVETTLLPLRTPKGNPICTRPVEPAAS